LELRSASGTLDLCHVRLPYQSTHVNGDSSMHPFGHANLNIHTVFYNQGILLAATSLNDGEDLIWQVNTLSNSGLASNPREFHSTSILSGKTWCISELPRLGQEKRYESDRIILVLSNSGLTFYSALSPCHILMNTLSQSQSVESDTFKKISSHFSPAYLCYLLLVAYTELFSNVSSNQPEVQRKLIEMITSVLLKHSLPLCKDQSTHPSNSLNGLGIPIREENALIDLLSPKIQGIYLYAAKLVESVWKLRCDCILGQCMDLYDLTILIKSSYNHLLEAIKVMQDLSRYLFSGSLMTAVARWSQPNIERLRKSVETDLSAFKDLLCFMQYFAQGLQLIMLLMDFPLKQYVELMSPSSKNLFPTLTFESLFASSTGRAVIVELMSVLIQRQIMKSQASEAVLEVFSLKCPMFFQPVDYQYFKAYEFLQLAKKSAFVADRASLVDRAFERISKFFKDLSFDRILNFSEELCQLHHHALAIKFCIDCLLAHMDSSQHSTPNLWLDAISNLIFSLLSDAASLYKNPPSDLGDSRLFFQSCLSVASDCKVEAYHEKLYSWFISNSWLEIIPSLPESPFLQDYLLKLQEDNDSSASLKDLLWKYFVHHQQFLKAARCLLFLAESSPGITLSKRMEYLLLARVYCMNQTLEKNAQSAAKVLLQEINDRVDIAEIQVKIHDTIKETRSDLSSELSDLNEKLYTLSDLFNNFTQPLSLYELDLDIIEAAQYSDYSIATSVWSKLIKKRYCSHDPVSFMSLLSTVSFLGRRYLPSELAFPTSISMIYNIILFIF
jgi:hypothetical protein